MQSALRALKRRLESEDEKWRIKAACSGSIDLMFTEFDFDDPQKVKPKRKRLRHEIEALGKAVCSGCEVKKECLDWALRVNSEFGIAGGLTPQERRNYKKSRHRNRSK